MRSHADGAASAQPSPKQAGIYASVPATMRIGQPGSTPACAAWKFGFRSTRLSDPSKRATVHAAVAQHRHDNRQFNDL